MKSTSVRTADPLGLRPDEFISATPLRQVAGHAATHDPNSPRQQGADHATTSSLRRPKCCEVLVCGAPAVSSAARLLVRVGCRSSAVPRGR